MKHHRRLAVGFLLATAVLAGCGTETGTPEPAAGNAPELPTAAAAPTTAEPAADEPARNERGNIVKELGEQAGWGPLGNTDSPEGVRFSLDKIEVDPPCEPYMTAPEGKHTLLLHVRIATGSSQESAAATPGVLNAFNFAEIGSDGVTHSAESGMCTDPANDLMMHNYGPNQKYTGTIELVVPEASGTLMLTSPLTGGGWEWKY